MMEIPVCDGCGKRGSYLCRECRLPDSDEQERNHNIRQPDGHNFNNRQIWE